MREIVYEYKAAKYEAVTRFAHKLRPFFMFCLLEAFLFLDSTTGKLLLLKHVCIFNGCPLWQFPLKGTASTWTRSFKEVLFSQPCEQTWPVTHHWLSGSQLWSRALRLVWETMKRNPRTNPGPFVIGPSGNQTRGDPHFTSRGNHQILSKKDPLQAVGLLLWLGVRSHCCRRRKYYSTASTTSESSSKDRLLYVCITGYATTPPSTKAA